jgi:hypothetical protein
MECADLFAGMPAPKGGSVYMNSVVFLQSNVGASLLAKAECQSIKMLGVMASSRAGSLPQKERGPQQEPGRLEGRLAADVDFGAPLTTLAERRHCGVGIPAWMPG